MSIIKVLFAAILLSSCLVGCDRPTDVFIQSTKVGSVEVSYRNEGPSSYVPFGEAEIIRYRDHYFSARQKAIIQQVYSALPVECRDLPSGVPAGEDVIFLIEFKDEGGKLLRKDRYSSFSFRSTEFAGKVCGLSLEEGDEIRKVVSRNKGP